MTLYFQVQFLKLKCTENTKGSIKGALKSDRKKNSIITEKIPKYQRRKCKELKRDVIESRRQYQKRKYQKNSEQKKNIKKRNVRKTLSQRKNTKKKKKCQENPEPKREHEKSKYVEQLQQKRI